MSSPGFALGLGGRTVVVTGAAGGIGQRLAVGFAAAGAGVVGVDRESLDETAGLVAAEGAPAWHGVKADLADAPSVEDACRRIVAEVATVDAVVNNAALYGGLTMTPLEAIDLAEWDRVMAVNVRGSYLMVRHLLGALKATGGRVVNIASGSALRGSPFLLHYVASKGAVIAMTRAMATELGPAGISVNTVAPGLADTPSSQGLGKQYSMILEKTIATQALAGALQADDIVGAVLFLASPLAAAITGQTLNVDRGLTRS